MKPIAVPVTTQMRSGLQPSVAVPLTRTGVSLSVRNDVQGEGKIVRQTDVRMLDTNMNTQMTINTNTN